MNDFKWAVKTRMCAKHIPTLWELSKITGIGYQTMRAHLDHPERMKLFEVIALNEALEFEDGDLLNLLRGYR